MVLLEALYVIPNAITRVRKRRAERITAELYANRKQLPFEIEANPIEIWNAVKLEDIKKKLQQENERDGKDYVICEWVGKWPGPFARRYTKTYGFDLRERDEVETHYRRVGSIARWLDPHLSGCFGVEELTAGTSNILEREKEVFILLGETKTEVAVAL